MPINQFQLQQLPVIKMIPRELHRQIDRHANGRHAVRELPSNAKESAPTAVVEAETEVQAFKDLRLLPQDHAAYAENRLRIALAKRMQRTDLLHQPLPHLLRRQPRRQLQPRLHQVAAHVPPHRFRETLPEGRDVYFRQ